MGASQPGHSGPTFRDVARGLCVLSVLLPAPPAAEAASPALRFRHLGVEDGLSNSWVRAILKDSYGFVWLGTADGLDRYAGARIDSYRADATRTGSLASSVVVSLFEDSQGRLWIGTSREGGGVALYDRERDRFDNLVMDTGPASEAFAVHHIYETRDGRLLVAATTGLHELDPAALSLSLLWRPASDAAASLQPHAVYAVAEDETGRLWIGTESGLRVLEPGANVARRWATRRGDRTLPSSEVYDMYLDDDGVLWCADHRNGVLGIDTRTEQARFFPGDAGAEGLLGQRPRRLAPAGDGRLAIGTEDAGLSILDVASGRFEHYGSDPAEPSSLGAQSIYAILHDDQGILWVGTFNGGVAFASPFAQRFGLLRAGRGKLSSPHVSAIHEAADGTLWIGTDGGGLNRLERATGRVRQYRFDADTRKGLLSDAVVAVADDARGRIWVSTWPAGLQVLDPGSGRFTTPWAESDAPADLVDDTAWSFLETRDGRLVIGFLSGKVRVHDPESGAFPELLAAHGPPGTAGQVGALAEDARGDLWIARNQPAHLDRRTGAVTEHALDAGRMLSLLIDTRGNVWFGTSAGGLHCRPASGGAGVSYTVREGLPSNHVASILEDGQGSLWLGTSAGLVRFEAGTQLPHQPRFSVFDARDGLQGDGFAPGAALASRSGELYFGGERGISFFRPEDVRLDPHPPKVVLMEVQLSGRPVVPGGEGSPLDRHASVAEELTLSAADSMVTLEFAALDFAVPGKNLYRYRLEGFDREWSPPSPQHSATYTNLPPGEYRFRVRASNGDGVWSDGTSLRVRRLPRFHETTWFAAVCVLLALLAAAGAHRLRLRRQLVTERELQRRVEEALGRVTRLSGFLPTCAWCRRVRDDRGYWNEIEAYLAARSGAEFSRSLCPACARESEASDAALGRGGHA